MSWAKCQLGTLVKIKTGKLDVNAGSPNGVYPFFTCAREVYSIDFYDYDCECVLVAGNGDLNVKYFNGKFNAYQRTYIIEAIDPAVLDTKFLYFFLEKYVEKLRIASIGGIIKYIKLNNLTDISIPLPPLPIQKKIAAVLEKADELRRKREEQIKRLDDLLQATFLDMFGDPVTNPKGWPKRRLGELISFLTSGSRGWAKYYSDSGRLFLRIQNVKDAKLKLDDIAYVKAPDTQEAKRTLVQPGDVLISITADLGRTAVIPHDLPPAHINQHLALIRPEQKIVNPVYLASFLESKGGKTQFAKANKAAVKAGLNFDDIKSVEVLMPPIQLQESFLRRIKGIEKQQEYILNSLNRTESLFASLMQNAFSGKMIF